MYRHATVALRIKAHHQRHGQAVAKGSGNVEDVRLSSVGDRFQIAPGNQCRQRIPDRRGWSRYTVLHRRRNGIRRPMIRRSTGCETPQRDEESGQ